MSRTRLKSAVLAATLLAAGASAQAVTLLSEDFAAVAGLGGGGWVINNASTPVGLTPEGWFQGDGGIFSSQSGAPEAFAAANFNNADVGGTLSTWLITPTFSTALAGTVTFWARADIADGYSDHLAWGMSGGGTGTGDFTLSAPIVMSGEWTQYSLAFAAQGPGSVGRFAIAYLGDADASNYVAVDTLSVNAVPEPATWLLLGGGLFGLGFARRRSGNRC